MNILALDLATKTGWALKEDGKLEYGLQVFDVKRGESPGMRFLRFNRWLREVAVRVELIIYEQAHNRGGAATEIANGFTTRVQEFCAEHGIEHSSVHTATLKKFATGSGRAGKEEMVQAAQKSLGYQGNDDDEADALWLLEYARKEIVG